MRVLFDVSHPAHVHLFKHPIRELIGAGAAVEVTSREKDLTTELLDAYNIDHTPISVKSDSKLSLISEWTVRELRMFRFARSFDPEVIVSRLNPPAAHVATLIGCPSIVFDDSEAAHIAAKITHPFADVVCTPNSFTRDLGAKQQRYDGCHELAYLHPDRFDPSREHLVRHGVEPDERFFIFRFVGWGAHHDVGEQGLSDETKRRIIDFLSTKGEVYITSESTLPAEFEEYQLPLPPHVIHHLLYYADLYVGDSQTMASEAGVLGTPTVRCNTLSGAKNLGYLQELEDDYDLIFSTTDEEEAYEKVVELATADTGAWERRKSELLSDKRDVSEYILETIDRVTSG